MKDHTNQLLSKITISAVHLISWTTFQLIKSGQLRHSAKRAANMLMKQADSYLYQLYGRKIGAKDISDNEKLMEYIDESTAFTYDAIIFLESLNPAARESFITRLPEIVKEENSKVVNQLTHDSN